MHFLRYGRLAPSVLIVGEPAIMSDVRWAAERVAWRLGWFRPNVIANRAVPNAAAGNGTVFVNALWLESVLARHCGVEQCRWGVLIALMAHECTHLAFGDTGSTPEREARADFYAGMVVALEGLSPDHFKRVLADLSRGCNDTHGCDFQRMANIQRGYLHGLQLLAAAA